MKHDNETRERGSGEPMAQPTIAWRESSMIGHFPLLYTSNRLTTS